MALDNFIFFGLLYFESRNDGSTFLKWIRYLTRSASIVSFFGAVIISSVRVSLLDNDRMGRNHFVGGFATALFIGVPLTFIEEINLPDSQLWTNLIASAWLFIVWYVSFSIIFKQMRKISAEVNTMKANNIDYKETRIGHKYLVLTYHLVLYGVMLWAIFLWLLIPFSQQNYFWVSQLVLDGPFLIEMLGSVIMMLTVLKAGDGENEMGSEGEPRMDETLLVSSVESAHEPPRVE
jgi:hypothetical protein